MNEELSSGASELPQGTVLRRIERDYPNKVKVTEARKDGHEGYLLDIVGSDIQSEEPEFIAEGKTFTAAEIDHILAFVEAELRQQERDSE